LKAISAIAENQSLELLVQKGKMLIPALSLLSSLKWLEICSVQSLCLFSCSFCYLRNIIQFLLGLQLLKVLLLELVGYKKLFLFGSQLNLALLLCVGLD
jgi:hypothetical protein